MTVVDVWRVRVGFLAAAEEAADSRSAAAVGAEIGRHLKRFPGAEFEFDAADNAGFVDVVVEGPLCQRGSSDAATAAAVATGIVAETVGVVLGVPADAVPASVVGEVELVRDAVVWGGADHDAPIPDSERHGFLRRRGIFGDRLPVEERRAALEHWHDDVDVKIGVTAGF